MVAIGTKQKIRATAPKGRAQAAQPAPTGGKSDPRVDAYVGRSRDFAKPILAHLRALVHKGCPQATETVKWGMPFFEHRGILAYMAAFNAHCGFGIWKGGRVVGAAAAENREAMGHLGRITSPKDLPKDSVILGWVKAAAALNESAANAATGKSGKASSEKPRQAVAKTTSKTEATRSRRLAEAMAWIAEGKERNWKYQRK